MLNVQKINIRDSHSFCDVVNCLVGLKAERVFSLVAYFLVSFVDKKRIRRVDQCSKLDFQLNVEPSITMLPRLVYTF